MKLNKYLFLLSAFLLLPINSAPEGAFTTLHVKAMDVAKYVDFMKKKSRNLDSQNSYFNKSLL